MDGDENDPLPITARSDALYGLSCVRNTVSAMADADRTPKT